MQLLATDVPVGVFSPGSNLMRVAVNGLSNCLVLQQDAERCVLLTTGPEPWLEWQLLPGWNLAVRQQPLEVVGPSLEDIAAVLEPALQGFGINPVDQDFIQLQGFCLESLRLEQPSLDPVASNLASDDDLEFVPWDGTPQHIEII
jgi:hypothetical protein